MGAGAGAGVGVGVEGGVYWGVEEVERDLQRLLLERLGS